VFSFGSGADKAAGGADSSQVTPAAPAPAPAPAVDASAGAASSAPPTPAPKATIESIDSLTGAGAGVASSKADGDAKPRDAASSSSSSSQPAGSPPADGQPGSSTSSSLGPVPAMLEAVAAALATVKEQLLRLPSWAQAQKLKKLEVWAGGGCMGCMHGVQLLPNSRASGACIGAAAAPASSPAARQPRPALHTARRRHAQAGHGARAQGRPLPAAARGPQGGPRWH
jgi:hypothetical protein